MAGEHGPALLRCAEGLIQQPGNLDLRLRGADCLVALGDVPAAVQGYTALVHHAAGSGHPLRALAGLCLLDELCARPSAAETRAEGDGEQAASLNELRRSVASRYSADSGRIGRGVRPVPSDASQPLSDDAESLALSMSPKARARAIEVVTSLHGLSPVDLPQLTPVPLLSDLSVEDFLAVFETARLVRVRAGQAVIREGDAGHSFFLVARGALRVERGGAPGGARVHIASLEEGAVFGEMSLITSAPRSATVIAERDTDLLEIERDALDRVRDGLQRVSGVLDRFMRQRLISNLLGTAGLFRTLDKAQRMDLARRFVAHEVAAGTDLIREGEQGRGLFILLQGKIDVWKRDENSKVLLATLEAGEVFGEIAAMGRGPATASVTSVLRSVVLFLERGYLQPLLDALPAMRAYLETLGDTRVLDTQLWLNTAAAPYADELDEIEIEIEVDPVEFA